MSVSLLVSTQVVKINEYMTVIHESHPWKSSMKVIHESYPWKSSMKVIHEIHPWKSSMKIINESHVWKLSMMTVIHESHPWKSPHPLWQSMIVHYIPCPDQKCEISHFFFRVIRSLNNLHSDGKFKTDLDVDH